ncbi:uncharacterized protein FA14DRAFT_185691 [Meira miltonrushii]|uniref:Uncharacterized protein n=1 Tax=Meira miltonrushii TaxID=1280837 RepID=A0A316V989_9BASI|nr:uncharacterized protein FA14DRAFT_185691 [Meira miltonrushii]PWN32753.1 hypothetical protein FA14DRAFT_185691 [Meira miltonrushii]
MTSANTPKREDVEIFIRLFDAHLAQSSTTTSSPESIIPITYRDDTNSPSDTVDPTAQLELFKSKLPKSEQEYFGRLAEQRRSAFHANQAQRRQAYLHSLLVQLPPFSLSQQDKAHLRSNSARQRRLQDLQTFCKRFCTPSNIGVRPFFAALKRLLEAQSSDRYGRRLQWLLDDAVLMETGGDDFMQSAVYILKAVLHFEENKPLDRATLNPFSDEISTKPNEQDTEGVENSEILRIWTIPAHLGNLECASLARIIPSHVLPKRGKGSSPAYANGALDRLARDDEEQQSLSIVELPTGSLRYAPLTTASRDADYRGGWIEWIIDWVVSFVRIH